MPAVNVEIGIDSDDALAHMMSSGCQDCPAGVTVAGVCVCWEFWAVSLARRYFRCSFPTRLQRLAADRGRARAVVWALLTLRGLEFQFGRRF